MITTTLVAISFGLQFFWTGAQASRLLLRYSKTCKRGRLRSSPKEKAAEPGREALAAFLNIGRSRCWDTSCRRHVRLGSKLFENACLS